MYMYVYLFLPPLRSPSETSDSPDSLSELSLLVDPGKGKLGSSAISCSPPESRSSRPAGLLLNMSSRASSAVSLLIITVMHAHYNCNCYMQLMFTLLIPPDYRAAQVNVLFMKCLYPGKCYRRLRREFPSRVTNSYYVSFSSLLLGSSRTLINARGPINRLAALNELSE